MGTRSAPSGRQPSRDGRWRPSRSTWVIALVVLVLATVPVLVPLLVTAGSTAPLAAPPARAGDTGATDLPRPAPPLTDRADRDTSRSPLPPAPSAGSLAPTTASPTPTPSAAGSTPPPAPAPTPTVPPTTTPPLPTTLIAAPDLVVTAVSWSPAEPAAGDEVTFTATVRNAGSEPTAAGLPLTVTFAIDGTPVTWSDGDPTQLLPGESRSITATTGTTGPTWTATQGSHTLTATANPTNTVPESTDDNNTATTPLTVL